MLEGRRLRKRQESAVNFLCPWTAEIGLPTKQGDILASIEIIPHHSWF